MKGPSSSQNSATENVPAAPILIQGVGVEIAPALYGAAFKKAETLLRHHGRIIRIRIGFEQERASHCALPAIVAGRVEISGPDLVARVEAETLGSGLDLLIEKLDRMLRERTKQRVNRRNDHPVGAEFCDLLSPSPTLSDQSG